MSQLCTCTYMYVCICHTNNRVFLHTYVHTVHVSHCECRRMQSTTNEEVRTHIRIHYGSIRTCKYAYVGSPMCMCMYVNHAVAFRKCRDILSGPYSHTYCTYVCTFLCILPPVSSAPLSSSQPCLTLSLAFLSLCTSVRVVTATLVALFCSVLLSRGGRRGGEGGEGWEGWEESVRGG